MAIADAAGGIAQLIKADSQARMNSIRPCVMKFTAVLWLVKWPAARSLGLPSNAQLVA